MANERRRCKGIARLTGKPCRKSAVPGSDYCRLHGGGAVGHKGGKGRPKGSPKTPGSGRDLTKGHMLSVKHGGYSARLLPDEQEHYEVVKADLEEELGGQGNLSVSDRLLILRVAANAAKITVATEKDAGPEVLVPLQRLELELLRELKATRASKDTPRTTGTTPAEVMAALLMKVRDRVALAAPLPVEAEVIDAEFQDAVDVQEDDDSED